MTRKKKTAKIYYKTSGLSKKWQAKLQKVYDDHPEVGTNTFQFIYTAVDKTFYYDLNNDYDPIVELEMKMDGYQPPPPPPKDHEGIEKLAHKMLKTLGKKERKIVKAHLFDNKSFAQIGREMGYTRQNIKHHFDKSIKQLQEKYNDK